jgi:hypothetical protein
LIAACGALMLALATPRGALAQVQPAPMGDRYAVIVVGLPGDDDHVPLFAATAEAWKNWLTRTLDFTPERVLVCSCTEGVGTQPATQEALQTTFEGLAGRLTAADTLWVLTLGHGNYDGRGAYFHVTGADPDGDAFARWLEPLPCRQQVVWLTHACGGWWVKPLSKPGRVVIAATAADLEENETEFPHALTTAAAMPREQLDADGDKRVSINELFQATCREVDAWFKADMRLATEHAQLDDNGDGRGTEAPDLYRPTTTEQATQPAGEPTAGETPAPDTPGQPTAVKPSRDGELAATIVLPYNAATGVNTAPACAPN